MKLWNSFDWYSAIAILFYVYLIFLLHVVFNDPKEFIDLLNIM